MKRHILRCVFLFLVMLFSGAGLAAATAVTAVDVRLSSTGEAIPPLVEKRIAASIQTIGRHVFVGQDDGVIADQQEQYRRTVNDIVNRVLIGYTVEDIRIAPGRETVLEVQIRPWGETIHAVHTNFDFGSLPAMGRELALRDLQGADTFIEQLLIGLPVDALDWAGGAAKSVLEQELETMLPEFYPRIIITPGEEATVAVYFLPKLPVVRNVYVDLEAENLPKIIFLNARQQTERRYGGLAGLPVAFVQRHAGDVQEDLRKTLASQWVIRKYKLRVLPTVEMGENMRIHLRSETDFYDIQAAAYIDVNRREGDGYKGDENTVLKAHFGRKLGVHHEFYGEVEFKPSALTWNFIPGYFYRSGSFRAGYQYETEDGSHHLWLRQELNRRFYGRYDHDLTHHDNEFALGYKIHDYIGLEYVVADHDQWLRVIGYL
ncbi:hypothetical protein [Megasphaera vaginalis (ex Srinivasan et al. 2021)]|nr:hypothetical protein [Megasphaera vaginalis (ex Srinivasan et al. 2021)]